MPKFCLGTMTLLALVVVIMTGPALWAAEDWSKYDWSKEREVLGKPGETTAQAIAEAQRVSANSNMVTSMSTVGFDIPAGSTAEKYLQQAAQAGGGGYYRAEKGGQLARIMDDAAAGRPPQAATPQPGSGQLMVGRSILDGKLQGVADHFPSASELWVQATYTNVPPNSEAECVWRRNGNEINRSQRQIGGSGWVAFSIKTTTPGGFQAGNWSVSISTAGRNLGSKPFTIGQPAAAAAPKPAQPTPSTRGEALVFCRTIENNKPVGIATTFHNTTQLRAHFTYKQRPAAEIAATWYYNGKETARARHTIKAGDGTATFGYRRQDSSRLRPGTYRLELSLGGVRIAAQEVTVTTSGGSG
jgi:hypothetical protein